MAPLVSLAVATNAPAALTGSASGGLTIALDALGHTYMALAACAGDRSWASASRRRDQRWYSRQPAAQRRSGDAVAVCGSTHRESYFDIVMVAVVSARSSRSSR